MKLDLLYEFQPKIGPYDEPFRTARRRPSRPRYDEAIAEIRSPTRSGSTRCGASSTTSATAGRRARATRSCSAPSPAITERLRLGFGVSLMPPGFQHPARVSGEGRHGRRALPRRVEWGTGRSTPMEQIAFGVPTDDRSRARGGRPSSSWSRTWTNERISWDTDLSSSPSACSPEAVSRIRTRRPGWPPPARRLAITAGQHGFGLLSFALLQPVEVMADIISQYREAQASGRI